jgi:hypothetical protein
MATQAALSRERGLNAASVVDGASARRLSGGRRGGMGMLASAEGARVHRVRAVVDAGQFPTLAAALIAHDDEPKLRGLAKVSSRTTVGAGVITGDRHLPEQRCRPPKNVVTSGKGQHPR